MVSADDQRCLDQSFLDQPLKAFSDLRSLPVFKPADPAGQALEADFFPGLFDPSTERLLLGIELEDRLVGDGNIGGVPGKSSPAERSSSTAKHRADKLRYKSWDVKSSSHTSEICDLPTEIVAVVKGNSSSLFEIKHRLYMSLHRIKHGFLVALGLILPKLCGLF